MWSGSLMELMCTRISVKHVFLASCSVMICLVLCLVICVPHESYGLSCKASSPV